MEIKKYIMILISLITIVMLIVIFESDNMEMVNRYVLNPPPYNVNGTNMMDRKIFKILLWTKSYYNPDWRMLGSKPFETCEYKNCLGTKNRSKFSSMDAVLFHMVFLTQFPLNHPPSQKWIMHIRESPANMFNFAKYNNLFNATWTYHTKSDIVTNYSHDTQVDTGLFIRKPKEVKEIVNKNFTAGKTKIVAWFVSHCPVQSRRLKYVKQLQNHIAVDIYGRCGSLKCNQKNILPCFQMVGKMYKFYLSFENSLCEDYVTEKLWHAINLDIIPVVLGAYNYSQLLPAHSYIDVKDFASPKLLAEYLKMLDRNDTLYNEYLQWKGRYDIVAHPPYACNVCEYLNKSQNRSKIYDRLDLFWNVKTDCKPPTDFYKKINKTSWV